MYAVSASTNPDDERLEIAGAIRISVSTRSPSQRHADPEEQTARMLGEPGEPGRGVDRLGEIDEPASCSALAPAVATAMASSHMRMRFQSPMLTTSGNRAHGQKCVLLPTAPKMNVRERPPPTMEASAAGLDRQETSAGTA